MWISPQVGHWPPTLRRGCPLRATYWISCPPTALTGHVVQNLNQNPEMPFDDEQFDACALSFSFQYLTQPVAILTDIARLLKPGGTCHIAFSNPLFPAKAVFCWQVATDHQKAELIALCFDESGFYATPEADQVVAPGGGCDPLYVVRARRKT